MRVDEAVIGFERPRAMIWLETLRRSLHADDAAIVLARSGKTAVFGASRSSPLRSALPKIDVMKHVADLREHEVFADGHVAIAMTSSNDEYQLAKVVAERLGSDSGITLCVIGSVDSLAVFAWTEIDAAPSAVDACDMLEEQGTFFVALVRDDENRGLFVDDDEEMDTASVDGNAQRDAEIDDDARGSRQQRGGLHVDVQQRGAKGGPASAGQRASAKRAARRLAGQARVEPSPRASLIRTPVRKPLPNDDVSFGPYSIDEAATFLKRGSVYERELVLRSLYDFVAATEKADVARTAPQWLVPIAKQLGNQVDFPDPVSSLCASVVYALCDALGEAVAPVTKAMFPHLWRAQASPNGDIAATASNILLALVTQSDAPSIVDRVLDSVCDGQEGKTRTRACHVLAAMIESSPSHLVDNDIGAIVRALHSAFEDALRDVRVAAAAALAVVHERWHEDANRMIERLSKTNQRSVSVEMQHSDVYHALVADPDHLALRRCRITVDEDRVTIQGSRRAPRPRVFPLARVCAIKDELTEDELRFLELAGSADVTKAVAMLFPRSSITGIRRRNARQEPLVRVLFAPDVLDVEAETSTEVDSAARFGFNGLIKALSSAADKAPE